MMKHRLYWVMLACWVAGSASCRADKELAITAPAPGAVVKGTVALQAFVPSYPTLAGVLFELNGVPQHGVMTAPPYQQSWVSSEFWDGPATIQAVALNAKGQEIARSQLTSFEVDNGPGSLTWLGPDLSQILHGTVKIDFRAGEANQKAAGKREIERQELYVDGVLTGYIYGDHYSADLDTTQFANGRHLLHVSAYSFLPGAPPTAQLGSPITIQNGQQVMDLRPDWSEIFLLPGEKAHLSAHHRFTDGMLEASRNPMNFEFESADPKVATVSPEGEVSAVAPGTTSIALSGAPPAGNPQRKLKAAVRVVVRPDRNFYHFARDGAVLKQYDPARSIFMVAPFFLGPYSLQADPALTAHLRFAGVNTLTSGFYPNPNDGGRQTTFEQWSPGFERWFDGWMKVATDNDFQVFLTGDDIVRTRNELAHTATSPWAKQAIQLAFTKARDSHRVVGVDMMDEASFLGAGPTQLNPNLLKGDPPIPADAIERLVGWIREIPGHPPISWPVLGLSGNNVAHNWMGDPRFADYHSEYWTYMMWRKAYSTGASLPQDKESLDRVTIGRAPYVLQQAPMVLLTSITGPFYNKLAEGDHYQPGKDELGGPGNTVQGAIAQSWYGAATGAAGIRPYGYDGLWTAERRNAKIGARELQTGSDPYATNTDIWWGNAAAWSLIQRLTPYLLQPQDSAPDLGPNITVGARAGKDSRLLVAVNFNDAPAVVQVDLKKLWGNAFTGGTTLVRWQQVGGTMNTTGLKSLSMENLTLQTGEAAIWLHRPTAARQDLTPPTVNLLQPLPDAVVSGPVAISAAVQDDGKVTKVELLVDGKPQPAGDKLPASWKWTWDPGTATHGVWHALTVRAYDDAGNVGTAQRIVRLD